MHVHKGRHRIPKAKSTYKHGQPSQPTPPPKLLRVRMRVNRQIRIWWHTGWLRICYSTAFGWHISYRYAVGIIQFYDVEMQQPEPSPAIKQVHDTLHMVAWNSFLGSSFEVIWFLPGLSRHSPYIPKIVVVALLSTMFHYIRQQWRRKHTNRTTIFTLHQCEIAKDWEEELGVGLVCVKWVSLKTECCHWNQPRAHTLLLLHIHIHTHLHFCSQSLYRILQSMSSNEKQIELQPFTLQ